MPKGPGAAAFALIPGGAAVLGTRVPRARCSRFPPGGASRYSANLVGCALEIMERGLSPAVRAAGGADARDSQCVHVADAGAGRAELQHRRACAPWRITLRPWLMLEVFVVGGCVAYSRIQAVATASTSTSAAESALGGLTRRCCRSAPASWHCAVTRRCIS